LDKNFGLKGKDLENIISVLNQHPEVEKAYIFGSRAMGNFKRGSDVDIALKGDKLNFETTTHIGYQLNEETSMPYKFDVLNYHTINNTDLSRHIDRVAIDFFTR
jgi:predicted nucleotidyltransferase